MTQADKLMGKLNDGRITGPELISLLRKMGWNLARQKGSHETWTDGKQVLVLVSGRKDLKSYQIKEAQKALASKMTKNKEVKKDEEE